MTSFGGLIAGATLALGLSTLLSPAAQAQANRTRVSGVGDDKNSCSRNAPCKTFAKAVTATAARGEIDCLDGGSFGAVLIQQSISIVCDDVPAGVVASANAIAVNTGANDIVVLKGLTIDGSLAGTNGIRVTQVGRLEVYDSTITDFATSGTGISFAPTNNGAALLVRNSLVTNNTVGILIQPSGAPTNITALIEGSEISGNSGAGINAGGNNLRVAVTGSSVTRNANGVVAITTGGATTVSVRDSMIAFNTTYGVAVNGANAKIWLSGNTITGNAEGTKILAGAMYTYGDNLIFANPTWAAMTPANKQ
jgi:hypothetical protein